MALDEKVSSLIGRIYESADDLQQWDQVLEEVRTTLGLRCLMQSVSDFSQQDMIRSTVIGDPRRPEGAAEYRDHAFKLDLSFRWAVAHPRAGFCDTEDLAPKENYLEQEFIQWNRNEWIGSTHWIVGYSAPEDDLVFGLSAHPWAEAGPLPNDQKALFRMLFEHMKRALGLASRLPLFASDEALVVLDRHGRIRTLSPAARALIEEGDGLTAWDNQLHVLERSSSRRLGVAIASALDALHDGGFGGAVALSRPSGKRDLLVTVTPLLGPRSPFGALSAGVLVRIVDPETPVALSATAHWAALFGFSPAEARFAETLMSGDDQNLRHAADQLGITYATARVHLKHLLEKTDTHSQSQLARLLTRVG